MDIYAWNFSAKGNLYTKVEGHLCVVGKSEYGWWALVDDEFLKGKFNTEDEAKEASTGMAEQLAKLDRELGVFDDK